MVACALSSGSWPSSKAYRNLGDIVYETCETLEAAALDALKQLRAGNTPGRGTKHLRLVELGEAISNQARRARHGDYTPIRRGPQPDYGNALDEMRKERDEALQKVTHLERELDRAKGQKHPRRERGPAERRWSS